ncbi:MAG: TaqI-like C-terminal specificity domain-containing protein, partial [Candidatus Paceibacterota bacterium]
SRIIDFGELPVFEEASTFPCIFLTKNQKAVKQSFEFFQVKELDPPEFPAMVQDGLKVLDSRSIEGSNWSLAEPIELDIIDKMKTKGIELEEYVEEEILRGLLTGYNKAFIIEEEKKKKLIDEDPKSAEIIKPVLKGNDIRFYRISFKNLYLILTKVGVDIENYPAIKKHLYQHKERLKKRYDQGDNYWELRACGYYDEFEKPKIIYPDIAKESRFTLDTEGYYLTNTSYFIPSSDKYVLGVLNSKLVFNYYKRVSSVLGDADKGGRMRWFRQDVSKIPIAEADKATRKKIESLVDQILTAKKENPEADASKLEAKIDRLVYELYGLSEEEIGV